MSVQRLEYGYRRNTWSPKYTSQQFRGKNQVTTGVNDFKELGFAMKALQNLRKTNGKHEGDFKGHFRERLATYMSHVDKLNPKNIPPTVYLDLIKMLKTD